MGVLREDRSTTTVEDAGAYERARDGGWADWDSGRPSAAELAEEAQQDAYAARLRQQREDAARARGEYVPSPTMASAVGSVRMALAFSDTDYTVTPVREGVLRVTGPYDRPLDEGDIGFAADRLAASSEASRPLLHGHTYEFKIDPRGALWVRITTNVYGEPFLNSEGVAEEGPPF